MSAERGCTSRLEALAADGPDPVRALAVERLDIADHARAVALAGGWLDSAGTVTRKACQAVLAADGGWNPESVLATVAVAFIGVERPEIDVELAGPGWGEPLALNLLCDGEGCTGLLHAVTRSPGMALPEVALLCGDCGTARPLGYYAEATVAEVIAELSTPYPAERGEADTDEPEREMALAEPDAAQIPTPARNRNLRPGHPIDLRPPRAIVCAASAQPVALSGKCGCS